MEYESVLLIGGPKDGERMSVIKGIPSIRMAQLPVQASPLAFSAVLANHLTAIKDVTYDRHTLRSHHGLEYVVYVSEGIDPVEALLNGYRKP